ncbi:MAG: hypothetical protein IJZ55_06425 [Lachnospiraceae bacterium]|nr:hypothetical protein [Lachnospiraceae bacterium]
MPQAWIQLQTTDASPWSADTAYQLFLGGEPQDRYLICYDNAILEIDFDWEVTTVQKKTVGKTFRDMTE